MIDYIFNCINAVLMQQLTFLFIQRYCPVGCGPY
jgi:hypothetical protein